MLYKYYSDAEVVVLPSTTRLESFGITLLEAMAMGKPIIATDMIPGAVELIRKSNCGLIVPSRNPIALADAINMLRNNSGQIGPKARKYVERFHDCTVLARWIDEIYREAFTQKYAM